MTTRGLNTEYFSGSQASIFIGDIWIDEIIDWQLSYGASATPIYGYGDTFFSHAAQGRVLVQGNFTINFKEPNYLLAIMQNYENFNQAKAQFERAGANKSGARSENTGIGVDYELTGPLAPVKEFKELGYVDKRAALDNFFYNGQQNKALDKMIKNTTLSTLDPRLQNNDYARPLFDIKIGYGTVFDENTIGEQIVGVKIIGKGKTIMANGEPLKESYSFFAQNLV